MTRHFFRGMILLLTFTCLHPAIAQKAGLSVKLNTGVTFSKPGNDLAAVSKKGNSRFFTQAEFGYALNFSKQTDFGFKIAAVASYERAHLMADNMQTQLNFTIPGIRARLYPLHYNGDIFKGLGKMMPKKVPFLLDLPLIAASYAVLNSLHVDLGVGFGKILESEYAYSGFQDVTVNRTMRYFGWGFHPPMFQTSSGKWSGNAVLDFGRYNWTNGSGGTSSIKVSTLGFGVQRHF